MYEIFLDQVCLLPWNSLDVASPEGSAGVVVRANHVYVECETPFIVAALSVETPEGEEHFEICLVHKRDQVRRFLQGPYPPHHRPNLVSWEKMFDEEISAFLSSEKTFQLLKKTIVAERNQTSTFTSLTYGLILSGAGKEIAIYADDIVPMTICVTSDERSIEKLNQREQSELPPI